MWKQLTMENTRVSVKRKDGKRFFNTVYNISISLEKALAANEIKI